ncbi:hypothetical protein SERLADRAFT_435244 [Serpula lacrymans var. lacrymans S7.9]|uniref:Uncharacterized protein n=1 Tax=Serpula lacrymans var. lacrymans (strain S7.9) TaxID=578457 RepID=F8NMR4_SERL9|nr:uncharacterized protein SERLADRAFT_435244 [Serpula lacrymans var. lacrymans S7.9]EGO27461.1 hypothetical protein SERLADRAFT_435244 [Serpula lacrymans var. lacrymans S7.9]
MANISHIGDIAVLYVNNLTIDWKTYLFTITPAHPGPMNIVKAQQTRLTFKAILTLLPIL